MQEFRVHCTSTRERRTADETLRVQLSYIADRAITGTRGRGWDYELGTISTSPTGNYNSADRWIFECSIRFYRKTNAAEDRYRSQRSLIAEWAGATGHNARFGSRPWICALEGFDAKTEMILASPNDELEDENAEEVDLSTTPLSEVGTIRKGRFFDHLYNLDSQIAVLLSSLQAAADSAMVNRFHGLLWGEPGCGKTEILLSVARLLQHLGVNYVSLDATSTTEAGMRKSLLDDDTQPPDVILIEEIEKVVSDNSLRWLLGIMDDRGMISQANYRRTASRKVPALVLATANDYTLLSKMMGGALLSRFSSEIYCPRPDRATLKCILERDVKKVESARVEWVEPTLSFMLDDLGITDPRKLRRVCLCGKDNLLDGSYQRDLAKTMGQPAMEKQKATRVNAGLELEKI